MVPYSAVTNWVCCGSHISMNLWMHMCIHVLCLVAFAFKPLVPNRLPTSCAQNV